MFDRPDFIGIGQMKAGTSWLFIQLRRHPGAWLPPKKELHFFNSQCNFSHLRRRFGRALGVSTKFPRDDGKKLPESFWRSRLENTSYESLLLEMDLLELDLRFFAKALVTEESRRTELRSRDHSQRVLRQPDFKWYSELFVAKHLVTGEITPAYADLDRETIRQIRRNFPRTKFIVMLRDPVSRAVSHINHRLRIRARTTPEAGDGIGSETVRALLSEAPAILGKSRLSSLRQTWLDLVEPEMLLVLRFEDVVERPERVLGEVADFLGLDPAGFTVPARDNRKAAFAKYELPPEIIGFLEGELSEERRIYSEIIEERRARAA